MDNFGICAFEIEGKVWISAEQYFQAMKFADEDYREEMRAETDGGRIWSMGQTRACPLRSDWEAVKVDVMCRANRAKFAQNADLRQVLTSTIGTIQAHGFPFWVYWNGIILMRLREEFRPGLSQLLFDITHHLRCCQSPIAMKLGFLVLVLPWINTVQVNA